MSLDLLFVRHVPHALQGEVMVGRMPDVPLAHDAPQRLEKLRLRLAAQPIDAVVASPLERAQATAQALAGPRGLEVETDPDLDEVDMGAWTGKTVAELAGDPDWILWNTNRAQAAAPRGESLADVQARMARAIGRLAHAQWGGSVLVVSHGDPIRVGIMWRMGWGIDRLDSFHVEPGSLSILRLTERGAELRLLNEQPGV